MTNVSPVRQIEEFLTEVHQWREIFLRRVLMWATVLGVPAMLATLLYPIDPVALSVYIVAIGLVAAAAFARMPYHIRVGIFLFLIYVVGLNNLLRQGVGTGSARLFLLALIIFAGLLISARAAISMFALSIGSLLLVGWLTLSGIVPSPAAEGIAIWATSGTTFLLLGVTIMLGLNAFQAEFARTQERSSVAISSLQMERSQLEGHVAVRTQELEHKTSSLHAATSIARVSSQLEDINELMDTVVNLTAERFTLNHAGIFLLDDRKEIAFLQASSSETGKELIARGYRVDVDKRSAISVVIERARYHMIASSQDSVASQDVDFPETRSRLILPLVARGAVIGLMDLHSEQAQAFSTDDADILQSLADLVAISIENVRLLNDTRALVSQLETLTAYQSNEAWQKYSGRRSPAYQYTPSGIRPLYESPEKRQTTGAQFPLFLRGQEIGKISLRRKDNATAWTERERDLIEKIATQVALALDNSRLVEEAQKSAQRDQLIANVSNRVRETLDVDAVVKTAALELRRVFDLKEAEVSVGSMTAPASPGTGPLAGRTRRPKPG
ncbi:MAG: GAF domain-containing protein [Chloroflexota bacterium]